MSFEDAKAPNQQIDASNTFTPGFIYSSTKPWHLFNSPEFVEIVRQFPGLSSGINALVDKVLSSRIVPPSGRQGLLNAARARGLLPPLPTGENSQSKVATEEVDVFVKPAPIVAPRGFIELFNANEQNIIKQLAWGTSYAQLAEQTGKTTANLRNTVRSMCGKLTREYGIKNIEPGKDGLLMALHTAGLFKLSAVRLQAVQSALNNGRVVPLERNINKTDSVDTDKINQKNPYKSVVDPNMVPRQRVDVGDKLLPGFTSSSTKPWHVYNSPEFVEIARQFPGLSSGINALVDKVLSSRIVPPASELGINVKPELSAGKGFTLTVDQIMKPGLQSHVFQVTAINQATHQQTSFILKVEQAVVMNSEATASGATASVRSQDMLVPYTDVIKLQELLKNDPRTSAFMKENKIEFANWQFAYDGSEMKPGMQSKAYALIKLEPNLREMTEVEVLKFNAFAKLAGSILQTHHMGEGVRVDNWSTANARMTADGRMLIVDPFMRTDVPHDPQSLKETARRKD
jgi:hypothetical protein